MKKVSDTQAKTPSGNTRTEEILDNINVLVGQISKAEDLCVSNLETLSSALDKTLLETIVHNTEVLVEFSFTQSNMLMGIAGYLLGYKGISPTTNTTTLLGKVKNNEPLFLGPTEGSKFYGDLLEEILAKYLTFGGTNSSSATLNVVLSSIDGGNLDSLVDLIKELQKSGNVENIKVLTIIQSLIQKLDDLGKADLDAELINMKMDDVQLVIFNIGEVFNELSNLERRMKGIDLNMIKAGFSALSNFDFTGNLNNMKQLIDFINNVAKLKVPQNINKKIIENTDRITEFIKVLIPLYTEMGKVPKANYKKTINNIVKNIDALPDLLKHIASINFKGITASKNKQLDILVSVINNLCTLLNYIEAITYDNYEDALDVFSTDILPYFENSTGLVERISKIPFKKFNKNIVKQITSFEFTLLTLGDILKSIAKMLPLMEIIEGSKKDIIKAIDVLYNIIEIVNEKISDQEIKTSIDNIHSYAELMKDLATIFKYTIIAGALSIPALVGGLLLSVTVKTIFTGLNGALNSIQKFVSNKDTKTSIESMKTVIVSISLLMIFASIMGGIVSEYLGNIWLFLGMFTAFTTAVLGIITLIGGLVNVLRAKGGVEALSNLNDIIIACTFCMLAGALFMMIPNIAVHTLEFTILLALFVGALLGTFLGISFITGRKTRAQMDEFTKLITICAGVLLVGALFMMIPNIFVNTMAFAGLLFVFTNLMLLVFVGISKLSGRKIRAQMDEFSKLIAICAGVLMVGALFMMIPEYRENAWIFALTLGVFVFAIVGTIILYSRYAKGATLAALSLMLFTTITAATLMYGANFISDNGVGDIITFGAIVAGFTISMVLSMVILTKAAKNIVVGTLCMIALVGVTYLIGFAIEKIAEAYTIFKDPAEAFICLGWIAAVITTFAGVIFGLGALMGTGVGAALFAAGVTALASLGGAVWAVGEAMKSISEGIKSIKALSQEKDTINVDNIKNLIVSIKDIAENFDVLDKISVKNIERSSKIIKSISTSISSISEVIKDTASLKIPIYNNDGSISGYRQLTNEDFKMVYDNVGIIVTSLADALGNAYDNNQTLFIGNRSKKVIKALKGVSDIVNKFTDVIVKFANSEYQQYDENGNPTGKKVHINDTIINQMKGSIETLITAVLGSISEIYADPKTQTLFNGKNLQNATNAIKDVSAIIGGLGKGIVDLAALYIKDENGKVVQMDSTHFAKAKQNLKDIITCILGGVDDLSKDTNFKKFTESGGIFGTNSWDVPTNIKKNLDKVKPLIDSAVENINSINEAVKVLNTSKGGNGEGKIWTDLLAAIFDPLNSFEIEDDAASKKKKESIKKSLENARSIINEINRLDEDKADKFIKLSQELRDLSLNVGDMSGFMEALNGKINDTLNRVSECLIESTRALQKSDEAHEKRNEVIKKNTAELKKVLETPMKVSVITNSSGSSTQMSFSDANIGASDGLSGLNVSMPNSSTTLPESAPTQPITPIDNSTLTSIAGTASDILATLRELLEKQ